MSLNKRNYLLRGKTPLKECFEYDTKLSDREVPVLELLKSEE